MVVLGSQGDLLALHFKKAHSLFTLGGGSDELGVLAPGQSCNNLLESFIETLQRKQSQWAKQ